MLLMEGWRKEECRSIHVVTERMAAPGCGSGGPGGEKLLFTGIFMLWPLK